MIEKYTEKMQKSVENLEKEYNSIRAGRANPHVLDRIKVDYYGTPTPLQQVGNITVPEPRILCIQPWETSLLKAIEKAIQQSDVGINPPNDGKMEQNKVQKETDKYIKVVDEAMDKKSQEILTV